MLPLSGAEIVTAGFAAMAVPDAATAIAASETGAARRIPRAATLIESSPKPQAEFPGLLSRIRSYRRKTPRIPRNLRGIPERAQSGLALQPAGPDGGRAPTPAPLLRRLVTQRVPEIPARERAVRAPGLGDPLDRGGVGQRVELVGALDRPADAEVADGEHVGALQVEHQEHVRAPFAQPLDRDELLHHRLVVQLVQLLELELP